MNRIISSVLFCLAGASLAAQSLNVVKTDNLTQLNRKEIKLPEIEGYELLKGDFHIHTIFSDGDVWPTVRVHEAYYEGLDAIAITDHIERQPSKQFVGGDQNSAYKIALPEAERLNILLVKAGEITREMPPGHLNALFLDDVTKLEQKSYMKAIEEANKQGGFVIWNHPGWRAQQPDTCKWMDVHEEIYNNGWLHAIEVFNWDEYYPVAFDWCKERQLAFVGNSDIHMVASHRFDYNKYHRPMTLIFAKECSLSGLKEAMFDKQTVAWFANRLAGPEDLLRKLFEAALEVKKPFRITEEIAAFELVNHTDLMIHLKNTKPAAGAPKEVKVMPGSSVIMKCELLNGKAVLPYEVANFYTGTQSVLKVEINVIQ